MIFLRTVLGAILSLHVFSSAWADTTGLVVSVHDGDTLTVLVGKPQVKVRLAEIDAIELHQAFGQRSKQSLAGLCFQTPVKVEQISRDRYGRSVGKVECAGARQVATGMAWVYDRYSTPTSPHIPSRTLPRPQDAALFGGQ